MLIEGPVEVAFRMRALMSAAFQGVGDVRGTTVEQHGFPVLVVAVDEGKGLGAKRSNRSFFAAT